MWCEIRFMSAMQLPFFTSTDTFDVNFTGVEMSGSIALLNCSSTQKSVLRILDTFSGRFKSYLSPISIIIQIFQGREAVAPLPYL